MRKTKKAVSSRFRMNKSGKIKRARPGKSHLNSSKSRARKRRLRKQALVESADINRLRRLLPHG